MNNFNEEIDFNMMAEKPIDVLGILMKYLIHWKWFLLSATVCLVIAILYIKISLPQYQVETSIIFKDDQKGGSSEVNIFREMGLVSQRNNADNEVEILKKSLIIESVVRDLGIYTFYTEMKPIALFQMAGLDKRMPLKSKRKISRLYGQESPFLVSLQESDLNNLPPGILFDVTVHPSGSMEFIGEVNNTPVSANVSPTDSIVRFSFGDMEIIRTGNLPQEERIVRIEVLNPADVANYYLGNIEIELTSKTSSVAEVVLVCPNINLGNDFLRKYIDTYNIMGVSEQVALADKTSNIIDNHLAKLSSELSEVEGQVQNYKQEQGLTNISTQADLFNSQIASVGQRKMDIESQLSIVSSLNDFVQQLGTHDRMIPANSGINSPVLNSQIDDYNELVLERERLSLIASSSNQSMINLNSRLGSLLGSIKSGLQNEKRNIEIQLADVESIYNQNRARVSAIPMQERIYSDIKRQQNIKEELFLHLLQIKEEKYINMATVAPSSRLIDNVRVTGVVSPQRMLILAGFLLLGLLLPIIVIKIKDLLRYKISSKEELQDITSIPLLGEIPKANQGDKNLIKENCNDSFNEMVRLLRANLLFVINSKQNKVINILSSISGEGKTFVTINLAVSLALLEKKVLIIDLDIRKPKLAKELGLDNKMGMTLYLSGNLSKEELVKPSGLHDNLSVITAGAIPPNPNELLAKPKLDELINSLHEEYDFIFIDTAPIGLVSDGFLLNRLSDVNLYVVRADYTPKRYIEDLGKSYRENRLDKLYLVLNSINLDALEYRYGFGKRYTYGYQ